MVRPREFDEAEVLSAALKCFWARGFEATSMRDLIARTGITGASLYNAFGDKRALYEKALDRYVEGSVAARIERCSALPPREAIEAFFADIVARSLGDPDRKGCMLVNAALEVAPHDPAIRRAVAGVLTEIETFFRQCILAGQADGSIAHSQPADDLARHLLGILMGLRVLARVRPERALLEGLLRPAMALLEPRPN
ncbi:MAG TPA: TetR/AcrR family transcriptional regulator [Ferrovibrio sp.]|jgi:TetR/AcrR family transcriptional repressor of nem operon|uniref:TetR/AcrR family transcriptional regulator n=1 Tax=Ferrovibrio sp. TaxID=1917215 RepID=UPI002ED65230